MSLKTIKDTLEAYLVSNIADIAIKRHNTTYHTLNGIALIDLEVEQLDFFIEAKLLPISQDRKVISSAKPIDYRSFFQIDIYVKTGNGMGTTQTLVNRLDGLFREHIEGTVICESTTLLNSFSIGGFVLSPYRVTASLMEA